MLLGKCVALAVVAMVALFGGETEARHKKRSHGWRKLVHYKCAEEGDATVALGGEINKNMMRSVKRLIKRNYKVALFINGRDLKDPYRRRYRRRNQKFIESIKADVQIGVLPWSTKHKFSNLKRRHIGRLYKKSAEAVEKVIGYKPLVAHVSPRNLTKRTVKYLHRKKYHVVGNTVSRATEKNLNRKSLIGLLPPISVRAFNKFIRHVRGANFSIVGLNKCLGGKKIYEESDPDEKKTKSRKHGHRRHRHHRRHHH